MFEQFTLFDAVVVIGALLFVLAGLRRGLLVAGGSLIGFAGGVMLAMAAAPWAAAQVANTAGRFLVATVCFVLIVSVLAALGARLGFAVKRALNVAPVRVVDAAGGALLHAVMAFVLVAALVTGANGLGVKSLSNLVATSPVLRAVEANTPAQLQQLLAKARPSVVSNLPQISTQVFSGGTRAGSDSSVQTPAVAEASGSVVRISGVASQCSQSQYGSGFVVAQNRVLTNAHVVSGDDSIVVEVPGKQAVSGQVVSYDAATDLAVIATEGLDAQPLAVAQGASAGDQTAFIGYPLGGPQATRAAAIQGLTNISIERDGSSTPHTMEVYALSGNIEQGNSGGPLLNLDGEIVGAIFAKSVSQAETGYALSLAELKPIIDQAPSLSEPVSNGSCSTSS